MQKITNYVVLVFILFVVVGLYHNITFYPHQTAQRLQPIESRLQLLHTLKCNENSWPHLFSKQLATQYGAYSGQVMFKSDRSSDCTFGYSRQFLSAPVNDSHQYRYASVTKWVVATLFQKGLLEHRFSLDDKLLDWIPEVVSLRDERVGDIRLHHLLNHSAGFDRLSVGDEMFKRAARPWCPATLQKLSNVSLSFSPGEKQSYSNVGYCLLGEVIARAYEKPLRDVMNEKLSLNQRGITFAGNRYLDGEVKYDFRFEEYLNDNYLTHYDFDAVSAPAGLMGSSSALLNLLESEVAPRWKGYELRTISNISCNLKKVYGCMQDGAMFYQPDKQGIRLTYHGGYFPGSTSIAILDSYGGITVVLQSGADKPGTSVDEKYQTIYRHLSMHYLLQGKVPAMRRFIPTL